MKHFLRTMRTFYNSNNGDRAFKVTAQAWRSCGFGEQFWKFCDSKKKIGRTPTTHELRDRQVTVGSHQVVNCASSLRVICRLECTFGNDATWSQPVIHRPQITNLKSSFALWIRASDSERTVVLTSSIRVHHLPKTARPWVEIKKILSSFSLSK